LISGTNESIYFTDREQFTQHSQKWQFSQHLMQTNLIQFYRVMFH